MSKNEFSRNFDKILFVWSTKRFERISLEDRKILIDLGSLEFSTPKDFECGLE